MKTLIDILKEETKTLKEQYLLKTKEWATATFNDYLIKRCWDEADWCKRFGITPESKTSYYGSLHSRLPSGFYNTQNARIYFKERDEAFKVSALGLEKYLQIQEEYAVKHYENSIAKLASRIEKKGLDISKLSVKTSHIGVNINTTLTDGEKKVRAFTIIASGEIQRPHYRYLIK